MDSLLTACIELAQRLLEEHGEFYPFGHAIQADGRLELVSSFVEADDDRPDSAELLDLLCDGLAEMAKDGRIRASAVCADVRVRRSGESEARDAIQVAVEHRDADPVAVLMPYVKKRLGGFEFDELTASAAERRVFP
jgi:hypothetical protein